MDLEKIAPIIEEILKKTLEQKRYPFGFAKFRGMGNKVASGKLRDSIQVKVNKVNEGETVIQVLAEQYSQWVQSGRLPGKKGVPISAIENWIKSRNLQGRDKKGKFIKRRSFAFAIQNNIKKFGIRPSNFLDVALEMIGNDPKIMELIGDEAYDDLINLLEGI
jgi:hypothetical protein